MSDFQLKFDETLNNNLGRNFDGDIYVQIMITTNHDDLWDGSPSGQPNPFYDGRDKHNNPVNMGEYKWRRIWLPSIDTNDKKGDALEFGGATDDKNTIRNHLLFSLEPDSKSNFQKFEQQF